MILSVDDGSASDLRIADLSKKYEIPAVFYWPVEWQTLAHQRQYEPLNFIDAWRISREHEIGSHTITHRLLTRIPMEEAKYEIAFSKVMLSGLFGKDIKKFCPPRGYTNDELTAYTLELYDSQRLTTGDGLVHVHPDSGVNNNMHWLEYANTHDIEEVWCHGWELDLYPEEWNNLERYLSELASS